MARIPSAYQEIEYIESTGTQWIDTGVANLSNICAELDLQVTSYSTDCRLIGGYGPGGFYIGIYSNNYWFLNELDPWSLTTSGTCDENRHLLSIVGKNCYIDNALVRTFDNMVNVSYSCYLFNANYQGSPMSGGKFKCYKCKLFSSSSLIRNFVPCYRISDGKPGLYDTVNDVFYVNSGSGEFTKGPDVYYREDFQEVEYIESTGTQYIDTGFITTSNSKYEFDFTITSITDVTGANVVCGGGGPNDIAFSIVGHNPYSMWFIQRGNPFISLVRPTWEVGLRCKVTSIIDGYYSSIEVNGYKATGYDGGFNLSTRGQILFATCRASTQEITHFTSMKLYSCRFYDNGSIARDFMPCYNKHTGAIGLYDKVNDVFYPNKGTGTFLKGPDVLPKTVSLNGKTLSNVNGKGIRSINGINVMPGA